MKPGGRLHVADWGAAQDVLMRVAYLGIQLLDGLGTIPDSVRARLPGMMQQVGFHSACIDAKFRTLFGTMEIVRAVGRKPRRKPRWMN